MTESVPPKATKSNYAIALEVGGTATAWIVIPALLAVFGGQALDTQFQTAPWIFISAMALAFAVTLFGIIRMAQNYLQQEDQDKNNHESGSGTK